MGNQNRTNWQQPRQGQEGKCDKPENGLRDKREPQQDGGQGKIHLGKSEEDSTAARTWISNTWRRIRGDKKIMQIN